MSTEFTDIVLEKFGDNSKLIAVGDRKDLGPNGLMKFRVMKLRGRKR